MNKYELVAETIELQEKEIERLIISLQAQEELTMNEHIKVERLKSRLEEYQEYVKINHKEIERLNNIINELEKYIKESCWKDDWGVESIYVKTLLGKLQELKGSNSNE